MGNPTYITATSVSCSAVVNISYSQAPVAVSVAVTGSSSGTFTYSVLYTMDDPQYLATIGSTRAPVFFSDTTLTSATSGAVTNYLYPIAGVKLSVSAISSAVVTMCVLQANP